MLFVMLFASGCADHVYKEPPFGHSVIKVVNKTQHDVIKINGEENFFGWFALIPKNEVRYVETSVFEGINIKVVLQNKDTAKVVIVDKDGILHNNMSSVKDHITTLYLYETKNGDAVLTNIPVGDIAPELIR